MTIAEQVEQALKAEKELGKEVEQLKAELAEAKLKAQTSEANCEAAIHALKLANEASDAMKKEHAEALQAGADVLAKEQAAHKATADELAKVKLALEKPEFSHAAMQGTKPLPEGNAEGKDETGEPVTFEQAHAMYLKIEDPKARLEFGQKYAKLLGLK